MRNKVKNVRLPIFWSKYRPKILCWHIYIKQEKYQTFKFTGGCQQHVMKSDNPVKGMKYNYQHLCTELYG